MVRYIHALSFTLEYFTPVSSPAALGLAPRAGEEIRREVFVGVSYAR